MKHIGIYLERRPNSGGAYQYCLAMLKALSQFPSEKFHITAFIMYEEWRPIVKELGIDAVYAQKNKVEKVIYYLAEKILPVSACRKSCRQLHPLARALQRLGVDMCIYPCADKISFMMDVPAVVSVFDLMHRYLPQFPEIADKKTFRSRERSYRNIAKYAELILVDSEVGKQQMVECYGNLCRELSDKVCVLPFIAPGYIYQSAGYRKEMPQGVFERYVFYPAQFWKHKNHQNLLKAIALLRDRKGLEVNLVCSGTDKNGYADTMRLIEELHLNKQIRILGYISNDDVVALYQHARALIMPTFGGPTNIPQLEAFVLGCPVATSGIFGIPEQVGDAALLFEPDSVEQIAECVERLWCDDALCEQLIQRGYERAKEWGEVQFRERMLSYFEKV